MTKEIEYRFLGKKLPTWWIGADIDQGYIHIDKEKQVRVRVDNTFKEAFICVKFHTGNNVRDEFQYGISYEDGQEIFKNCIYKLSKKRDSTNLPTGERIDIDLYDDGTIIAEIEVHEEGKIPELPYYFGENVDGVFRYTNYYFAGLKEEDYK